jgi:hypothetical protein
MTTGTDLDPDILRSIVSLRVGGRRACAIDYYGGGERPSPIHISCPKSEPNGPINIDQRDHSFLARRQKASRPAFSELCSSIRQEMTFLQAYSAPTLDTPVSWISRGPSQRAYQITRRHLAAISIRDQQP